MTAAVDMPEALDALDGWLAEREATFGDVRPEADARIVWADGTPRRTETAIVYLHGYSATRMETAPLSDHLARTLGANLFYARLAGHGRDGVGAMGEPTAACWRSDAEEALAIGARLGERVILIGCSTGATLATLLASADPTVLAAVVLLAPNYGPKDPRTMLLTWPGARTWVPWLVGAERIVEAENDAHARYWTLRYPSVSLIPMMELVQDVRRAPLEAVRAPVLAIWCEEDTVVDAARIEPTLARMTGAVVETERVAPQPESSNHVFVGDAFGPEQTSPVLERILGFLAGRGLADAPAQGSSGAK